MKNDPLINDDSWESDAVWKLLDASPPSVASPRFVDDTMRAVRLLPGPKSWWNRLFAPAPLVGLAGSTAAVIFTLVTMSQPPVNTVAALDTPQVYTIQDIAESETLIAAADQLDDFSDNELVSLIGF